jgi:hypothetical protein
MRRFALAAALALGACAFSPALESAHACAMCKIANEDGTGSPVQNARPRAYMYSILFMLSMPATLTAGFGLGFYRLWKKQQELAEVSIDPADAPEQIV